MNRRAFLRGAFAGLGALGLGACGLIPTPPPTETPTPVPTDTIIPSITPSRTPTLVPTATVTPTLTPTPTLSPTPVLAGTPIYALPGGITETNITQMTELARWGRGEALDMAWSPDGQRLAVVSDLGIFIYQSQRLELERVLETAPARRLAFSPDGNFLVTAGKNLVLWDVNSWQSTILGTCSNPTAVAFMPDGISVWLLDQEAGEEAILRAWTKTDHQPFITMILHGLTQAITDAVFSADLGLIALHGAESPISIWSQDNHHLFDLPKANQAPGPMAFSPDGSTLAVGYPDTTLNYENSNLVRIYALPSGVARYDLLPDGGVEGATETLLSIAFAPDGSRVAAGYANNTVRIWSSQGGPAERKLTANGAPYRLAYSPDGSSLAGSGMDIWDAAGGTLHATLPEHFAPVQDLKVSPDGSMAVLASYGHMEMRDISNGAVLRQVPVPSLPTGLCFSPDGILLSAACADGAVRLYRSRDGAFLSLIGEPTYPQWAVAFSPDGKRIIFGGQNGLIQIYDVEKELVIGRVLEPYVTSRLAYLPDGARYASLTSSGLTIRSQNGDLNRVIAGIGLEDMAFSPDGALVALAGNDILRMVETATGKIVYSFFDPARGAPASLAGSPDGAFLAVGRGDGLIDLYWAGDGTLLHTLHGHRARVTRLAFTTGNRQLLSASQDGSVRVWGIPGA